MDTDMVVHTAMGMVIRIAVDMVARGLVVDSDMVRDTDIIGLIKIFIAL